MVFHPAVSDIRCKNSWASALRLPLNIILEELTVAIVIFLILIINRYTVMMVICYFHYIGNVTPVLFS